MEIQKTDYQAILERTTGTKLSVVKDLTEKCDNKTSQITEIINELTNYEITAPNSEEMNSIQNQIDELTARIYEIEEEMSKNQDEFAEIHEKYVNGEITQEEFESLSAEIDVKNEPLKAELFSCMNQRNLLEMSLEFEICDVKNNAEVLDTKKAELSDELNYSSALAEVTSDKASDLVKNGKTMKWLGVISLGITSIIAAVRDNVSKNAKESSAELAGLNNELRNNIESIIDGEDLLSMISNSDVELPESKNTGVQEDIVVNTEDESEQDKKNVKKE